MYEKEAIKIKSGEIGIMPTDTIYGIVGQALNPATVKKIYGLKNRDTKKPFIILISSPEDLQMFDIEPGKTGSELIKRSWPGPVSIIFPSEGNKFQYIHRGKGGIAFRIPDKKEFRKFLKETGPLVAPSANPEGDTPARNIEEAKEYFGDRVDFYIDGGEIKGKPSRLLKLTGKEVEILR